MSNTVDKLCKLRPVEKIVKVTGDFEKESYAAPVEEEVQTDA